MMLHTKTLYEMSVGTVDLLIDALEEDLNFNGHSVRIVRMRDGMIRVKDYDHDQSLEQYRYYDSVSWDTFEGAVRAWLEGGE